MTELPAYKVVRRARLRSRIHLHRDESGCLLVSAPPHWSEAAIHGILQRNTARVRRFLARHGRPPPKPLAYVPGEMHYYLGERHKLVVARASRRKSRVELETDELRVRIGRTDPRYVKACLQGWYRARAKAVFSWRLRALAGKASWTRGQPPRLEVRRMRRCWGNCSSTGLIRLNTHLVKAPLALIDSVLAHELCHLAEMHHGPAFYRLLEGLNPNWRSDRAELREQGPAYLLE